MPEKKKIVPVTLTAAEAAQRHRGVEVINIQRMCLRGKYLVKRHGGVSRVPVKELARAIFALKVGKSCTVATASNFWVWRYARHTPVFGIRRSAGGQKSEESYRRAQ